MVFESLVRNPRRKLLAAASLAVGIAVATATLGVALDVEDRLAREFRSLGANILVTPQSDTLPLEIGGIDYRPVDEGATLPESGLGKLRTIFWRLNIIGFSPFLEVPVEARAANDRPIGSRMTLIGSWYEHIVPVPDGTRFATGLRATHPWWHIDGHWFADGAEECVVGVSLARRAGVRVGDPVSLTAGGRSLTLAVTGLLTSGGPEEEAFVAPLVIAQRLAGRAAVFRRLLVSALTKPEDDFARRDPASMPEADYDRWYCTPYVSSIARQIEEALPGTEARPLRRLAESEGRILGRVGRLFAAVTLAALLAAGLAIGATSASTVLERTLEIGMMKALGATNGLVTLLILAEQVLLALLGGGAGYGIGVVLSRVLGRSLFGASPTGRLVILPIVLLIALLVAILANLAALRSASRLEPAPALRGE